MNHHAFCEPAGHRIGCLRARLPGLVAIGTAAGRKPGLDDEVVPAQTTAAGTGDRALCGGIAQNVRSSNGTMAAATARRPWLDAIGRHAIHRPPAYAPAD